MVIAPVGRWLAVLSPGYRSSTLAENGIDR
jgi:hypothetical protein